MDALDVVPARGLVDAPLQAEHVTAGLWLLGASFRSGRIWPVTYSVFTESAGRFPVPCIHFARRWVGALRRVPYRVPPGFRVANQAGNRSLLGLPNSQRGQGLPDDASSHLHLR